MVTHKQTEHSRWAICNGSSSKCHDSTWGNGMRKPTAAEVHGPDNVPAHRLPTNGPQCCCYCYCCCCLCRYLSLRLIPPGTYLAWMPWSRPTETCRCVIQQIDSPKLHLKSRIVDLRSQYTTPTCALSSSIDSVVLGRMSPHCCVITPSSNRL